MSRLVALLVALGLLLGTGLELRVAQAAPTPPKKPITYPGVKHPPSVFDHQAHMKPGRVASCSECHPKLFKTKALATKFTMADITAGKACGACHNGKKAFSASECARCHPKK